MQTATHKAVQAASLIHASKPSDARCQQHIWAAKKPPKQHRKTPPAPPDAQPGGPHHALRRRDMLLAGSMCPCCLKTMALTPAALAAQDSTALSPAGATWYQRYFASSMKNFMGEYYRRIEPVKERLFRELFADGQVHRLAELGIGTGPNQGFYARQQGLQVTGIEPNGAMAPFAQQAFTAQPIPGGSLKLLKGVAEHLPLESASQDAVVTTIVLCSVKNQQEALKEAMRVLRPGGKFLFIEHVLAPKDQQGTRFFQNLLTNLHLQQTLADGCHLNRETLAAVEQAGFKDVDAMRFTLDGFSVIGPHVAGIATV